MEKVFHEFEPYYNIDSEILILDFISSEWDAHVSCLLKLKNWHYYNYLI